MQAPVNLDNTRLIVASFALDFSDRTLAVLNDLVIQHTLLTKTNEVGRNSATDGFGGPNVSLVSLSPGSN